MKKIILLFRNILNLANHETKKLLIISSVLGLFWFLLELCFVYILQIFLLSLKLFSADKLQIPSWFPIGVLSSTILLIGFGVVRAMVNYAKSYYSTVAQQSFIKSCRHELVDMGLDSKYFTSSSDFLTLFSDRVNQSGLFIQFLSLGIVAFSSVILFFAFGIYYAPKEMIFSLTLTILLMTPIKKVTYKIQKFGESLNTQWNEVNDDVILLKRNMFFLEVYDLIKHKKVEIKKNLTGYENNYISYASIASFLTSLPLLVGIFVLSICTYLSIEYFHTPGVRVLSFFYIFLRMTQGMSELNSIYAALRLNFPSFREVQIAILNLREIEKKQIQFSVKNNQVLDSSSEISLELNALSFNYPGEESLYRDLSLKLKTGDLLIIKGPSGAGKSTLLKLLLGLEKPSDGQVLINNIEVKNLDQTWRSQLGYVGPDPFLIRGTIRDNLHFGNFDVAVDDNLYWDALILAGLDVEFKLCNIGLDTFIAETSFLSTGQRQRLAIARAFVRKPRIVIFDEATANLDAQTEAQIIKNIYSLSSEILTIIVTHKNTFDKIGTQFISIGS